MITSFTSILVCSAALAAPQNEVAFQIPAGDLGTALKTFQAQAGCQVKAQAGLLKGLQSPGLTGTHRRDRALERLLKGTGILAVPQPGGDFELKPAGEHGQPPEITLGTVVVKGRAPATAGTRILTDVDIAQRPTANRSLTEILELNPAVRVNASPNSSLNRGTLDQEDISIHGASPYQNLFQLDGMSGTNNINPANHNANLQVGNVPSNSQAYFVDTALLGEVRILDSFIPVEYGRFTGGVVDARIKRATGRDETGLGYRTSHSGLSNQKVSPGLAASYDKGAIGYTPEWRKNFYHLNVDRKWSDRVGTVVGLSRRESSIERSSYEGRRTTGDRVDNALAKVSYWGQGGAVSDLTLKFSNRRAENQNALYRDTVWTDDHDAFGFTYAYEQAFKAGKFTGQVGWDRFGDRRRSDATSLVTYRVASPASTVTEGGFGKEATTSDTLALKARFDFNPMRSGAVEHRVYAGLQADRVDAGYERMNDAYSYQLYRATPTATPSYRSMVLYRQGQVDVAYQDLALYLADTLAWGRVNLQAGLRADRDTYLGNTNLSPRFAVEWDLSGARTTLLKAGVARYYGEGILELAFARAKSGLKQQLTSSTGAVVTTPTVPTLSLYGDLRSPHDDELALSATRFWAGLQGTLSYVRRLGRDQISPRTIAGGTQYVNDGRSTTDTAAFTLRNRKPGSFAGAEWTGNLEVDYTRSRRNYDLVTSYQETVEEGKLYYNGTLIDAVSRPASDFNQPMRASGELHGQWSRAGLGWTNRLSWKGRRQAAFYKGVNASDGYEIYEDTNIASYWTLDAILSWQPSFHRHLEFRVEVTNVLNRMPVLVPTSPTISTNRDVFVTGREIWFEANYRF